MLNDSNDFYSWFLRELFGNNVILRLTVSSDKSAQRANVAKGEAFAYYGDDEIIIASRFLYRAYVEPDGKTYRYEINQELLPQDTDRWYGTICGYKNNWPNLWRTGSKNVFTIKYITRETVVSSHPNIIAHLARMHGMLLETSGKSEDEQLLCDIAARRIDGAIRSSTRQWAQTLGL